MCLGFHEFDGDNAHNEYILHANNLLHFFFTLKATELLSLGYKVCPGVNPLQ